MTPDERAQLAAADWYERRMAELALDTTHPEDAAIALDILAHARRAELLDAEPSPYTIERGPQ
jgi:hypothetical protein